MPVSWEADDGGKYQVIARHPSSGSILNDHRSKAKAWLADRVNRFVTVFRPRVEALIRELSLS